MIAVILLCSCGSGGTDDQWDFGKFDLHLDVVKAESNAMDTATERAVDLMAETGGPEVVAELVSEVIVDVAYTEDQGPTDVVPEVAQPIGVPFSDGPYGTTPRSIAAAFSLPTLEGAWDFEEQWSGGKDSYIFAFYAKGYQYSEQLWNSSAKELFQYAYPNAHYFFLSYTKDAAGDVANMKDKIWGELDELGEAKALYWKDRIHFVPIGAYDLDNWISEMLQSKGYFAFAIDRFQQIREVGLLTDIAGSNTAKLVHLNYEVRYFNFEWKREENLGVQEGVVEVPVFAEEYFGGNKTVEVDFPSAEEMAGFDTMEFDLTMNCPDHYDDNCGEWDYLSHVYLCDLDDPEKCDLEIGRWITTYHREGRWVTDVSQGLAFLQAGGAQRLRFDASGQSYVITFIVRLSNREKGVRPFAGQFLWGGGPFNLNYNPGKLPITFEVPEGTKRVDVYAFITGHGFGSDVANCAEFCNHTHHFTVNGSAEFVKSHPEAGTAYGCRDQIENGVVPNQFGTWPFGRGGWCPGLDVVPFQAEVTNDLVSGENTIEYKALFMGQDYAPKPAPNPSGFGGQLRVSSWLIYWK
jgi:hypothetical protein